MNLILWFSFSELQILIVLFQSLLYIFIFLISLSFFCTNTFCLWRNRMLLKLHQFYRERKLLNLLENWQSFKIPREILNLLNHLKTTLVQMLVKNSVLTSKRTQHFTITKIKWLTLFKEIIAVYSENHAKPINTKCSITDCQSRWFIQLPLGLKGLRSGIQCTKLFLQKLYHESIKKLDAHVL
jgi:hypothetical protein